MKTLALIVVLCLLIAEIESVYFCQTSGNQLERSEYHKLTRNHKPKCLCHQQTVWRECAYCTRRLSSSDTCYCQGSRSAKEKRATKRKRMIKKEETIVTPPSTSKFARVFSDEEVALYEMIRKTNPLLFKSMMEREEQHTQIGKSEIDKDAMFALTFKQDWPTTMDVDWERLDNLPVDLLEESPLDLGLMATDTSSNFQMESFAREYSETPTVSAMDDVLDLPTFEEYFWNEDFGNGYSHNHANLLNFRLPDEIFVGRDSFLLFDHPSFKYLL
eukprot:TRINITY_DN15252_c0_g1_i1.p1 TRINITY_DN15252_c0_g1~~TRINITY_DN15252_c0_g1_i1.p1  ORF type:complete len:273 (-),score=53.80 TRINITY_DN15252_c0_g1_i1:110-928(-)